MLHASQKKTQKTKREDIELARTRYRQIGDRLDLGSKPGKMPYGFYPASQDSRDLIQNQIIHS